MQKMIRTSAKTCLQFWRKKMLIFFYQSSAFFIQYSCLQKVLYPPNYYHWYQKVSFPNCSKIQRAGLRYMHLLLPYKRDGFDGLWLLLGEKREYGIVRVTKCMKIVDNIAGHFRCNWILRRMILPDIDSVYYIHVHMSYKDD